MKAYTDLNQSEKLAEILPLESADMAWCNNSIRGVNYTDKYSANLYTIKEMKECFDEALNGWDKYLELIPCWSLAALLELIPNYQLQTQYNSIGMIYGHKGELEIVEAKCPLDTCYEMIIKLHEKNLL